MWPLNIGVYILPVSIRRKTSKFCGWQRITSDLHFKDSQTKTLPINTLGLSSIILFPQLVYTSMQVIMSEACQETITSLKCSKILQTPNLMYYKRILVNGPFIPYPWFSNPSSKGPQGPIKRGKSAVSKHPNLN